MEMITAFFNSWGMWSWMSIGVLLMVAELFIPGTFVVWFGFGALATGIIVGFAGTLTLSMQLLTFVIMSTISVIFGFFVYQKIFGKNKERARDVKTGAHRYIGKTYLVAQAIQNGKGKVTIGDSVWIAKSDEKIPKGAEVIVTDVDGTQLIVKEK